MNIHVATKQSKLIYFVTKHRNITCMCLAIFGFGLSEI